MQDYTTADGIKMAAYSHMIELSNQLKTNLELLTAEEIAENADIIAEYARILELLAEHKPNELLTIFYADGLNCFEILDN